MNSKQYWMKQNVDYRILKNFCHVFNHKHKQLKVAARINRIIPIDEIIVPELDGVRFKYYSMFKPVIKKYEKHGKSADYSRTKLWKFEYSIAPKNNKAQVRRRFREFFKLFDSIKKKGFKKYPNKMVRLIDTEGMVRHNLPQGERFSEKYYRLNGMKRCFIAKYLGIEKIPCRVLRIRIVSL